MDCRTPYVACKVGCNTAKCYEGREGYRAHLEKECAHTRVVHVKCNLAMNRHEIDEHDCVINLQKEIRNLSEAKRQVDISNKNSLSQLEKAN